jgi:hypothetical protein
MFTRGIWDDIGLCAVGVFWRFYVWGNGIFDRDRWFQDQPFLLRHILYHHNSCFVIVLIGYNWRARNRMR